MDLFTYDCPKGTPESEYIPLDVMSDYSIGESIARIPDLVKKAKSLNMKALALTDRTLAGAIEFYLLCKTNDIKPIIGQKIAFGNNEVNLLCKDLEAYKTLCRHSLEFQEANEFPMAITQLPLTKEECEHFICLTPYSDSELVTLFGDNLYKQVDFADVKNHPKKLDKSHAVIIMNPVRYIEKEDYEALAAFKHSISENPAPTSPDNYFADDSEIIPFLTENHHLELVENAQRIAEQVQFIFPEDYFTTPASHNRMRESLPDFEDAESQLRALAVEGFKQKLHEFENEKEARDRLAYELEDINNHHWEKVFLFHHEVTSWCRQNGIEVGPGRGSAPGSLVSYLLGITNVNPLKHGLIYERFLNPERLCYPDFDIDYDYERLPEVVNHLKDTYGEDRVVKISSYSNLKCWQTLEIAAKYLNYSEEEITTIIGIMKSSCLSTWFAKIKFNDFCEPLFYLDFDNSYHSTINVLFSNHWEGVKVLGFLRDKKNERIVQITKKLEGIKYVKNFHLSGYIVTNTSGNHYTPVLRDRKSGCLYCEYKLDSLEYAGLYKNDLLGLHQLTKLKQLSKAISKKTDQKFDYREIAFNDKETIENFARGNIKNIFHSEPLSMMEELIMDKFYIQFSPTSFEDLCLINALAYPGVADYIPEIIECKNTGHIRNNFLYCEEILAESYGFPIYQEQIMQIVQRLADYNIAEGDMFCRALGKKNPDVINSKKQEFIERSVRKGIITKKQAAEIFEFLIPFAGYAFNKSHAVAYTMMAYWEMYMKVHFPKEYKKVIKNFRDDLEEEDF